MVRNSHDCVPTIPPIHIPCIIYAGPEPAELVPFVSSTLVSRAYTLPSRCKCKVVRERADRPSLITSCLPIATFLVSIGLRIIVRFRSLLAQRYCSLRVGALRWRKMFCFSLFCFFSCLYPVIISTLGLLSY